MEPIREQCWGDGKLYNPMKGKLMTGDGSEKILDVIIRTADITRGQGGHQGPRLAF